MLIKNVVHHTCIANRKIRQSLLSTPHWTTSSLFFAPLLSRLSMLPTTSTSTSTFSTTMMKPQKPFSTPRKTTVVKHVAMFRLKSTITNEQREDIKASILALPQQCPEIMKHELGMDIGLNRDHPLGPNRDFIWSITCNSVEDYQRYHFSDAHQAVHHKIVPLLDENSEIARSAVQYYENNTN